MRDAVLIANRGEIALRIIRACQELGLGTVLAASSADRDSLPARQADRVVVVGGPRAGESYLLAETMVQAAISAGCFALHPGYGFLSESPELARLCEENGIAFVGPRSEHLEALGDKLRAREVAAAAGVPVLMGGPTISIQEATELAAEIGYPVLIKAARGGGGRGMKRVDSPNELEEAWRLAGAEAASAFGDGTVFIERYVVRGKHVEVQVAADAHGNSIHLGERECSVQYRHQKVIEEAPCAVLPQEIRAELHEAALQLVRSLGFLNLGTVEFLCDLDRSDFAFLEVNPRLQVEHPVTEAVTGIDLVREQIGIARGEELSIGQEQVRLSGHAVECRITAQNPDAGLRPTPGRITRWRPPAGGSIRIDSHGYEGYLFPPYYDALLAKVIAHGPSRDLAIETMADALSTFSIEGIPTTVGLHRQLLADPVFAAGDATTSWLGGILGEEVVSVG